MVAVGMLLSDVPTSVPPAQQFSDLQRTVEAAQRNGLSYIAVGQHFAYGDLRWPAPRGSITRKWRTGLGCRRRRTVGKWRSRSVTLRLDGLGHHPRPRRPSSITAQQVEDIVVTTLESAPKNATYWSRPKMAQHSGLSKSSVGRIWRAFELKPHRTNGFKSSSDPCQRP